MKFEFNLEVSPATSRATRVIVTCGKSEVEIFEVPKKHGLRIVGGGAGDWLPIWDWREMYVDKDKDRKDFALPYRQMLALAKEEVRRLEINRLIREAKVKLEVGLHG